MSDRMPLTDRLDAGPVICAEGFLFELERRGYLTAGEFVPEVALEHPEALRALHVDFQRAGSDVVEAFTYNGHREKMRVIGKEDLLEPLNRAALQIAREVADARPGDQIYVTGDVGDAALSLMQHRGELKLSVAESAAITDRLARPMPRVDEGLALRGIASSAIDLSDGLLADLGHVLEASAVGARLELARVPLSSVYRARLAEIGWEGAIANGDDYELCFTVPPERIPDLERMAAERRFVITRIGEITEDRELDVRDPAGKPYRPRALGHDHFAPA